MTAQHTPGPWEAECRDVTYKGGDWSKDNFLQWEVYGPEEPTGRGSFHQADALLIAAAPDLLEALQEILQDAEANHIGGWDTAERLEKARAAIQKATNKEQAAAIGAHKEGD